MLPEFLARGRSARQLGSARTFGEHNDAVDLYPPIDRPHCRNASVPFFLDGVLFLAIAATEFVSRLFFFLCLALTVFSAASYTFATRGTLFTYNVPPRLSRQCC